MSTHKTITPARSARRAPDQNCPAKPPPSHHQPRARTRAPYRSADLPLAVWPCAQKTSQWQRHGRYLPESNRHPGKMLPALAKRAIETYSDPGDLVLDPMCGIGTTLIEATHLQRQAVGVEMEARWAKLARANIKHAHNQGAPHQPAHVIKGDARQLPRLLSTHAQHLPAQPTGRPSKPGHAAYGHVDLILTSPPYACEVADVAENSTSGAGSLRRKDTSNYSPDRSNLGHARGNTYLAAMAEVYAASAAVLKPGGFLVLVTKDMRRGGALRNLSGDTITLCEEIGLRYWQHIIGLLATIRDNELVMRPSLWQILQTRRARTHGERTHVAAHEDILVFRKPEKNLGPGKPNSPKRQTYHQRKG
jgi:modification methylase